MFPFDFLEFPLLVNLGVFAAAATVVWFAGTRLTHYADTLAERTGLGDVFVGLLVLALATELPEVATTITAALRGQAALATSNIFGGIVLQTSMLAVADFVLYRTALTYFDPDPALLLQGVMLMILLGLTLAAISMGSLLAVAGIGITSALLMAAYLGSLYLSHQYKGRKQWLPKGDNMPISDAQQTYLDSVEQRHKGWSMQRLWGLFAAASAVILLAGVVLARTSEAIAAQTGLGATFIGATLLAVSTSLPELSTSIAAIRLGNGSMAISNIFGSNSIMVMLLFISDIFYREGPILETVGSAPIVSAAMGLVVTGVYLVGMIERRNATLWRMGYDSVIVVVLTIVNLAIVYHLR